MYINLNIFLKSVFFQNRRLLVLLVIHRHVAQTQYVTNVTERVHVLV